MKRNQIDRDAMRRPIFVVGCYRSGTTLVERILRAHPAVGGLGFETALFTHVLRQREPPAHNASQWAPLLSAELGVQRWREVREPRIAVVERILAGELARRGQDRWVEKTPFHVFHAATISRLYPEARIVHVLRDGRDVVASILRTPYVLPRVRTREHRLVAASVLWKWMSLEGRRIAVSPETGARVLELRYEDLVQHEVDATLRRVSERLDLPWSDEIAARWKSALASVGGTGAYAAHDGISARSVGRFRDPACLRPEELEIVELSLAHALHALGYAVSAPGTTGGFRRRARLRALDWMWSAHRVARFHANAGYWTPPHLGLYLRAAVGANGAAPLSRA